MFDISSHLKGLYNKLQDDESRAIFKHRLLWLLENKGENFLNMQVDLESFSFREWQEMNEWKKSYNFSSIRDFSEALKVSNSPVIAYCAGASLHLFRFFAMVYSIEITCFCDRNPALTGTEIWKGCPVIDPETLARDYKDAKIIITNYKHEQDICETLIDMGFSKDRIFTLPPHFFMTDEQYFWPDFMQPTKDEIFVDCGCYDGGTIGAFIKFCDGNYKKIYGLEPYPVNFKKTQDFIELNKIDNVTIIDKGVWSKSEVLSYSPVGFIADPKGPIKIPVMSIDELVGDDAVTFIKMDVEASELEGLKGAVKTIKKNKPKLAICIYHKSGDIIDIPMYIDSIVPDYKYYIRHFTSIEGETVLYAIPS